MLRLWSPDFRLYVRPLSYKKVGRVITLLQVRCNPSTGLLVPPVLEVSMQLCPTSTAVASLGTTLFLLLSPFSECHSARCLAARLGTFSDITQGLWILVRNNCLTSVPYVYVKSCLRAGDPASP